MKKKRNVFMLSLGIVGCVSFILIGLVIVSDLQKIDNYYSVKKQRTEAYTSETLKKVQEQKKVLFETLPLNVSDSDRIKRVKAFCNNFEISCKNGPSPVYPCSTGLLQSLFDGREYEKIHALYNSKDLPGDCFECKIQAPYSHEVIKPYAYLFVGVNPDELFIYSNQGAYDAIYKNNFSHEQNKIIWPEFMSEEKAKKIVDTLGAKLNIPDDMEFERMVMSDWQGTWAGIWLRKRDGYRYEGDAVTINIMGGTGEFIGYTKTYRDKSCATDVKISKEDALKIAWTEFRKILQSRIRERANEIYEVNAALVIIHDKSFEKGSRGLSPVKIDGNKLAWVISYVGMTSKVGFNNPSFFEVRIDAGTGDLYYISEVPWYRRWFRK